MYRFLFASILFMIVGCRPASSGDQYIEDLVAIKNELQREVDAVESELKEFAAANQYDRIVGLAYRTQKMIRKKIDEISNKPFPKEKTGEEGDERVDEEAAYFSYTVLRYLEYMRNTYIAYEACANASTGEERDDMQSTIDLLAKQSRVAEKEMNQLYEQYKKANSSGIMR